MNYHCYILQHEQSSNMLRCDVESEFMYCRIAFIGCSCKGKKNKIKYCSNRKQVKPLLPRVGHRGKLTIKIHEGVLKGAATILFCCCCYAFVKTL